MNREDKISVHKDVSASVKDSSKKKTKKKRKKRKTYSSSDSSDSEEINKRERKKRKISTSSDSSDSYHHKKKKKKHKHKHKKDKDKSKKVKKEVKIIKPNDDSSTENVDRILLDRAKAMAPMTKEEWEKRQNVVRRVYDKETNRHRLIKGDGEVIEEIVSKERHAEINRKATKGDGEFFQSRVSTFSSR